jgi:hypothetical protein
MLLHVSVVRPSSVSEVLEVVRTKEKCSSISSIIVKLTYDSCVDGYKNPQSPDHTRNRMQTAKIKYLISSFTYICSNYMKEFKSIYRRTQFHSLVLLFLMLFAILF